MFVPDSSLLSGLTPTSCTVAEIEAGLAAIGRLRGHLDVLEVALVRRSDLLADAGQGAGGSNTMCDQQRVGRRRADQTVQRAETLEAAPIFEAALGSGRVGADHVDALGRAAQSLPDERREAFFDHAEALIDVASSVAPERFERHCRHLARGLDIDEGERRLESQKHRAHLRRWVDARTGMFCHRGELDPESGSRVWAALDAEIERLVRANAVPRDDRAAATALTNLATRVTDGASHGAAELVLIADVETYRWGLDDDSVCETSAGSPLPPSTVHRLSCDANADIVTQDHRGVPLSVGRAHRSATRAQRRGLRSMYPTCGFTGCDRHFDQCEMHHLVPWINGGRTDLDNLLPLCVRHHHLVHDQRWSLTLTPDRTLIVTRPDGTEHSRTSLPSAPRARQRTDERAEMAQLARNRAAALARPSPSMHHQREKRGLSDHLA